jgi:O-methyltransferase
MRSLDEIGRRALSTAYTLRATHGIARMLIQQGIPGDFVECGVFAGSQVAAMALAIVETGETGRRIHLFDSFKGIPHAGPKDNTIRSLVGGTDGALVSSGISVCSRADVAANMQEWGVPSHLLVYHEGWFQHTVPAAQIGPIALLRLDADLYESTLICLQYLYPRLSPGGWCIADDYGLDGCREAVDQFLNGAPVYWVKG